MCWWILYIRGWAYSLASAWWSSWIFICTRSINPAISRTFHISISSKQTSWACRHTCAISYCTHTITKTRGCCTVRIGRWLDAWTGVVISEPSCTCWASDIAYAIWPFIIVISNITETDTVDCYIAGCSTGKTLCGGRTCTSGADWITRQYTYIESNYTPMHLCW